MVDFKKVEEISTIYKWLLGFALLFLAGASFWILKSIVGLVLSAAIGYTAIKFSDVFALKIANLQLKALVNEIEENPIEILKNLYAEKAVQLSQFENEIVEFDTEIRNFDDQVEEFKTKFPKEAVEYIELSNKMGEVLFSMNEDKESARKELADLSIEIEKAEAIFKMATAAKKVTDMTSDAKKKVFQDIKKKVALDSVRTRLNRTFAKLDSSLQQRKSSTLQLDKLSGNVIEGEIIKQKIPMS